MASAKKTADANFSYEQLVLVTEAILISVIGYIESSLPSCIDWDERVRLAGGQPKNAKLLTDCEQAALNTAGSMLSILYSRIANDGMSEGDVFVLAGNFHLACERFVSRAWANKGQNVKTKMKSLRDKQCLISEYFSYYPNARYHAEKFVKRCWPEFKNN